MNIKSNLFSLQSFSIKIDRYVPYICTAIHNGSNIRSGLSNKIALDDYERWYEEDPHTAVFIASMPITLVGNDSRYEYELNRKEPVYDEAWGKQVWKKPLSKKELKVSAQKHENYYKVTHALIEKLEDLFGASLVYDVHSYNHQRWDRDVPVFNIGVEKIDTKKYAKYINNWKEELEQIELTGITVKAELNDVFYGRGYNLEYITKNFNNTLVLATEISKIYCDEKTGEIYPQVIKNIQARFKKAILNNANLYVNDLTNWKYNDKNMLLDNSITKTIQKIDNHLYRLLKSFEMLTYINPINVNSEKARFFKSKFTVNPNFKYKPIKINPYELTKSLHSIDTTQIEDITIRHLYESVITGCIDKINLLSSIGTDKFLYNSLRYFGRPNKVDIRNAEYILLLPEIKEENIRGQRFGVDKAKEISKAAAEAQAKALENIKDEVGDEEVPLNDPFAGNAAASSSGTISFDDSSDEEKKLSLNNFKLVGIISGKFESYVSLADSSGKVITIQLNEELEEGLKFVDLRLTEAIFEKEGGKYVVIDFKNRVKEVDEY